MKNLFITGGSGFLGKALLARLIDLNAYDKIYVLIRGHGRFTAAQRLDDIIQAIFPASKAIAAKDRVIAVSGDLTLDRFGLEDEKYRVLTERVTDILHVGASTDFSAPIGEARLFNVKGTETVLDLARAIQVFGTLNRFDYVSTAYVAGTKRGLVNEDALCRQQDFANSYEQSKYEAEVLVRSHTAEIPIAIHRPSIVVGDSRNGYTPHFKVLYWPLRLLSKEFIPFFATNINAHLDVVPVDYVTDGIVALMNNSNTVGETFHLTAGMGREIRIREFLNDAYQLMKVKRRPILPFWLFRFIQHTFLARLFHKSFWEATKLAEPYLCYLRGTRVRFDNRKTAKILDGYGISPPHWRAYRKEIMNYCISSRWGKRLPLPEYVYYLPAHAR